MGNTTTIGEDQPPGQGPTQHPMGYGGSDHERVDGSTINVPHGFTYREFTMEERDDTQLDETSTEERREDDDESTPSLKEMEEEEDDDDNDDIIPFEVLSDCMLSMTSLETEEMAKGFDLYMQQQHQSDCDSTESTTGYMAGASSNSNNSSLEMSDMEKGLSEDHDAGDSSSCSESLDGDGIIQTPLEPWSLRKWLHNCSTSASASASVGGIQYKTGFEPDLHTLDGIRKELFFFGTKW